MHPDENQNSVPATPVPPTVGRIVHYVLCESDVEQINRRRIPFSQIKERTHSEKWPDGVQAHVGNEVKVGDVFPAVVVALWSGTFVNLHVLLDGSDTFWATSRQFGTTPAYWYWPPRA